MGQLTVVVAEDGLTAEVRAEIRDIARAHLEAKGHDSGLWVVTGAVAEFFVRPPTTDSESYMKFEKIGGAE